MLKYHKYSRGRIFLAPNNGVPAGTQGGTQPSPQPAEGQAAQGNQGPPDLFAAIDPNDLPEDAAKAFEKIKTDFAALQNEREKADRLAREHQSRADRAQAELEKTRQAVLGNQQPVTPPSTSDRIFAQLTAKGIPTEQAKSQAQLLGGILDAERDQIRQEMGQAFAPVANIALQQQATDAFRTAQAMDRIGALANPDVSQLVWNGCLELAGKGQQITPDVVKNLAAMHYMNHLERNGGNFATLQNGTPAPNNGMNNNTSAPSVPGFNTGGGFNYPGATFHPTTPVPQNNNAPRFTLDAATQAAVDSVTNVWKKDVPNPTRR